MTNDYAVYAMINMQLRDEHQDSLFQIVSENWPDYGRVIFEGNHIYCRSDNEKPLLRTANSHADEEMLFYMHSGVVLALADMRMGPLRRRHLASYALQNKELERICSSDFRNLGYDYACVDSRTYFEKLARFLDNGMREIYGGDGVWQDDNSDGYHMEGFNREGNVHAIYFHNDYPHELWEENLRVFPRHFRSVEELTSANGFSELSRHKRLIINYFNKRTFYKTLHEKQAGTHSPPEEACLSRPA